MLRHQKRGALGGVDGSRKQLASGVNDQASWASGGADRADPQQPTSQLQSQQKKMNGETRTSVEMKEQAPGRDAWGW